MFKTCKMVLKSINSFVGRYGCILYIIEKCHNLLSQLLKVVHTSIINMGFKMTIIIELVGTQAIFKLLSHYFFELSSKNRLCNS